MHNFHSFCYTFIQITFSSWVMPFVLIIKSHCFSGMGLIFFLKEYHSLCFPLSFVQLKTPQTFSFTVMGTKWFKSRFSGSCRLCSKELRKYKYRIFYDVYIVLLWSFQKHHSKINKHSRWFWPKNRQHQEHLGQFTSSLPWYTLRCDKYEVAYSSLCSQRIVATRTSFSWVHFGSANSMM